ncbi:barstar family protein [Lentzea sp. NBRC 102530]|uniref:barstar family protein n=1 Tax=Lentzea sp. NBRC 102530 TaxID=3032201 RepID=UPI0024A12CA1|nr:barstar family protein [Lentzea sp. NBRC 102530]GLY49091.1 hypothetical protein Lesp01_27470 [Lentzea sp. NBRC 102530]
MTFPIRYEVVRGGEVLLRAVDAEGLFADKVVPPRELFVFRGCPPDVASSFDEVFGFEVADDNGMYQWWALVAVAVHAVTPEGDVFATASPCFFPTRPGGSAGEARYQLRGNSQNGLCASIDGFPRTEGSPDRWPPVRLIGGEMASVPFGLEVLGVEPSSPGDGLVDSTFDQSYVLEDRTSPHAGGRPDGWSGGGVFHLDGRYATDAPGLFLALNEGLLGPGAYFGRAHNDVQDHLHLPCCGPPPDDITLVWHHADVARYAVPEEFEWAVKTLGHSVDLVFD